MKKIFVVMMVLAMAFCFSVNASAQDTGITENDAVAYEQEQFVKQLKVAITNWLNATSALMDARAELNRRGGASAWLNNQWTSDAAIITRFTNAETSMDTINTAVNNGSFILNLEKVARLP